jgi:threonine dehydratase
MIGRADIEAAYERISPYIRRTPVVEMDALALGLDFPVTLKMEHLQATGSFKLRGAFNNLLTQALSDAGVVATSGGNHGAGVAYAATALGKPSTIYVPASIAAEVKLRRMRGFGADVVAVPDPVGQAYVECQAHAARTGALEIHPFDSDATLAGQGTVALELSAQAEIDTLLVSVGGGGLIGGILSHYQDDVRVISVETEQTASLAKSREQGEVVTILPGGISASGLGASAVGERGWAAAQKWLAGHVVVSDADTFEAQRRLWEAGRIVVEPSAATALAALTASAYVPERDERVAVLLCGGNAEPDWFMHEA